jgi:hypothetical protein
MKKTIKLRKRPTFMVVSFFITFTGIFLMLFGWLYAFMWWNPLLQIHAHVHMDNFKFLLGFISFLITVYLSSNKLHPLLGKCCESGLQWADFEPDSFVYVSALVRDLNSDTHLVIVRPVDVDGSHSLADSHAVITTTNQLDIIEKDLGVGPGTILYLSGIRRTVSGTMKHLNPMLLPEDSHLIITVLDLDDLLSDNTTFSQLQESDHQHTLSSP